MYKIVRFKFNGDNETVQMGLTLEEAQEWCHREDTHGDGWFDGYEAMTLAEIALHKMAEQEEHLSEESFAEVRREVGEHLDEC